MVVKYLSEQAALNNVVSVWGVRGTLVPQPTHRVKKICVLPLSQIRAKKNTHFDIKTYNRVIKICFMVVK